MFNNCLIGLHALRKSESSSGMCKKESETLFGSSNNITQLPFTRREFIIEQPVKQKGMSISGAQPKLSLVVSAEGQLNVTPNNGTYILKPSPEAYPGLAENEHAIMHCMAVLGFNVPSFALIPFRPENENDKPELAFIIKRYDRQNGSKIHQEQLDGAMGIDDKYGLSGEGVHTVSYEKAAKFLTKNVDGSLQGKRDIFLRIVCAYLLGNNDLHLRNIGVIYSDTGKPSIAPVYDFVSVVPYPSSFSDVLALPLLEKEECDIGIADGLNSYIGEYTGHDFLELAIGMGLAIKIAEKDVNKVVKKVPLLIEIINKSYMSDNDKILISRYITRRATLLTTFMISDHAI